MSSARIFRVGGANGTTLMSNGMRHNVSGSNFASVSDVGSASDIGSICVEASRTLFKPNRSHSRATQSTKSGISIAIWNGRN